MMKSVRITKSTKDRVRTTLILGCIAPALLVASCAQPETAASQGDFDPVPADASKQDYIQALQEMQPVTMTVQTLAPKGSIDSQPMERYASAIEKWSGGKISVEVAYSSSIASLPDAGQAIADGRLDFARHAPLYKPDEFPETNALVDLTFVGRHTPLVGRLQRYGAFVETAFNSDKIMSELAGADLVPALPLAPITPMVVLACKNIAPTTLKQMDGLVARASGRIHARQLEALGITSADLDITEIYQGLQRGVIDCGEMSLSTLELVGAIKVANHVSFSPKVGFADTPGAFSFSKDFWSDLPLPAKQLLWDRLEIYVLETLKTQMLNEVEALEKIAASGGVVKKWGPSVVKELRKFNKTVLDRAREDRPKLVEDLLSNIKSWRKIVTKKLGYQDGGKFSELPSWYSPEKVSFERYMARFMETVMKPERPS